MSTRLLLGAVFAAAVAACLATVGLLLHDDLQLVRNITGHVTPDPAFWVFLGVGGLLVLAPAFLAWRYFVAFQAGRVTRISEFVADIAREDEESPGPLVPLRISNDEAGRLSATFNVWRSRFQDEIERHVRSREELTRIDREKGEFLSIVSHELRTPLNTILGFSQLLIEGTEGELSESQLEDVRIIQMSGKNLLGLINDILDLSAIESGTIQIHPTTVDVASLARDIDSEFRGQLKSKKTEMRLEVEGETLLAHADRKRVYQIINNLVSNAVKFTPKGTVTLKAGKRGDFVEVVVSDTGAGIPEDDLGTIFSEFQQSGTSTMRSKGTGLGLAICKKLVDMQGGDIAVQSREGKGSTFTFTLPRETGEEQDG
jgi:signal transduction histidine kinase